MLNDKTNKKIFDEAYIHLHSQYNVDESLIVNNIKDKDIRNHLTKLIFKQSNIENDIFTIKECINRLKKNYIKNQIENLRVNLKDIDHESDKLEEIVINIAKLEKEMNEEI